jgi:3-oxoacyl-[acyl-carrier-protein] synthase-1
MGHGLEQTFATLEQAASGLRVAEFERVTLDTYIGIVPEVDHTPLRADLAAYDCRNNRLAQMGLMQDGFAHAVADAAAVLGAERIGVFLGTSTSGILETEQAYRQRAIDGGGALPASFNYAGSHSCFSLADFVRRFLHLSGPAHVISTACSSSAKVFAAAARQISCGVIDAAVVGGVDSLCLTTLYGFNSLELVSARPCRPFDGQRDGISVGEAAAFVLLTRAPLHPDSDGVWLLGAGESSDAHHMSSPHPQGLGAELAMQAALRSAGLQATDIDYINLHGTATQGNDAAEGLAVGRLFGANLACSSTKGASGHTLGAAGALEAVISALSVRNGLVPAGVNSEQLDPSLALDYRLANRWQPVDRVLSNSFGFGGTNCSLVIGHPQEGRS